MGAERKITAHERAALGLRAKADGIEYLSWPSMAVGGVAMLEAMAIAPVMPVVMGFGCGQGGCCEKCAKCKGCLVHDHYLLMATR